MSGTLPTDPVSYVEASYDSFSLAEVVAAYGEPTHVLAYAYPSDGDPDRSAYVLSIVYLSKGFRLGHIGGIVTPRVSRDVKFSNVTFFPVVGVDELVRHDAWVGMPGSVARRIVLPWQGEQPFSYYCRDLYEGDNACGRLGPD